MSAKRGARVAPPPGPGEWDVRFASGEAAKGWDELCRQVPRNARAAWLLMRTDPAPAVPSARHHRLHAGLATRTLRGRVLDRWQIEVTGAGRVWYLLDAEAKTVWLDHAGPGHPAT